jgi:DNA-binding winged helix-turn-helix (wHTH) protein
VTDLAPTGRPGSVDRNRADLVGPMPAASGMDAGRSGREAEDLMGRLARHLDRLFVGRDHEQRLLVSVSEPDGPAIVWVHGLPGVGKTTLVRRVAAAMDEARATVCVLDGRMVEPTPSGFATALHQGAGLGVAGAAAPSIASALAGAGTTTVVVIDHYESLGLLDAWLCHELAPRLPDHVRLVVAGRDGPSPGWGATVDEGPVRHLRLGVLSLEESMALLAAMGVPVDQRQDLATLAGCHPLALQVGAATAARPSGRTAPATAAELASLLLDELSPEATRGALALAVVRRGTRTLLGAMLRDEATASVEDVMAELESVPFVDVDEHGLGVHDAVRGVLAERLRATDPVAYRRYRHAAFRQLEAELAEVDDRELWRYTADLLYLVEEPIIRGAFFPVSAPAVRVVSGTTASEQVEALLAAAPTELRSVLGRWWQESPECFLVACDAAGRGLGLTCVGEVDQLSSTLRSHDPLTVRVIRHLTRHPMPKGAIALVIPGLVTITGSVDEGQAARAALFLDVKRLYLEHRPDLRRVYVLAPDTSESSRLFRSLGFDPFSEQVDLGGEPLRPMVLDMGPQSVTGWLALHAARAVESDSSLLDATDRTVAVGSDRVALSRLEYAVLEALVVAGGRPVSRAELIERAWGTTYDGGSNVVDAVIRTLRRRLGPSAAAVETVRGIGYRWAPDRVAVERRVTMP